MLDSRELYEIHREYVRSVFDLEAENWYDLTIEEQAEWDRRAYELNESRRGDQ